MRDLQELAGMLLDLPAPRDGWVHLKGVPGLGCSSCCWQGWSRDHSLQPGILWDAGEGHEEGKKKSVELVIQNCVMFAKLHLFLLKDL